MAGEQRKYRARIKSTASLKQIFKAMELIAASRIGRARDRMTAATPYSIALTAALSAAASHADVNHPLTTPRTDTNRVALLVVAGDRGMAGAYSANVLREGERAYNRLTEEGREVLLYTFGRRAAQYFTFRRYTLANSWEGESDAPSVQMAHEIADEGLRLFTAPADQDGCAELHLVHTRFASMVSQEPRALRLLPLEVVEADGSADAPREAYPLYDFEPSPEAVLDDLLPLYIRARVYSALLQSAASELAARQRAMHTAVDNAEELIRTFTRLANQARQSEITQEISEIVSGADALAAS